MDFFHLKETNPPEQTVTYDHIKMNPTTTCDHNALMKAFQKQKFLTENFLTCISQVSFLVDQALGHRQPHCSAAAFSGDHGRR